MGYHERSRDESGCQLSYVTGPIEQPLWSMTLSELLKEQAQIAPFRQCVIFSEANHRKTYRELYNRSIVVAKALLEAGIEKGNHIGISAGNCPAYVDLLFAASHVGAALVVFNATYTPAELKSALKHSDCKLLFITPFIGKVSNEGALKMLASKETRRELSDLKQIVQLGQASRRIFQDYGEFIKGGNKYSDFDVECRMRSVSSQDVCNLQFTSGTTGSPKAAMLTHSNIINNARFIGDRMSLTPKDIICCPPPLFHCFGLVLGLLACLTHGSSIVFPSETFQPLKVLQAIIDEKCTGLHGVPTMFSAELELIRPDMSFTTLRTGIAAGAPVSSKLMSDLRGTLNMTEITNTYGMTETSPASFMTFTDDPIEKRLLTVGKILPHMRAKVISADGIILPVGSRGELCVAGFALQKGYWKNPEKTAEVMRVDEDGTLWMHTGDEATIDSEGYCRITGRIKDIIIRGGENIFPLEIEEKLAQHPSVVQASVVGIPDNKYGEIVGAFLQPRLGEALPSTDSLRDFVRQTLGWHKAPQHIFWLKADEEFPKTGSGKIQKFSLKEQAVKRLGSPYRMAKL